jgi:hypothetical protein
LAEPVIRYRVADSTARSTPPSPAIPTLPPVVASRSVAFAGPEATSSSDAEEAFETAATWASASVSGS